MTPDPRRKTRASSSAGEQKNWIKQNNRAERYERTSGKGNNANAIDASLLGRQGQNLTHFETSRIVANEFLIGLE